MKRLLLPMIVPTASSCGVGEKPASANDQRWAQRIADACPALELTVARAMKDSVISNDEADAVATAAKIIVANPVKGQVCHVTKTSRPSSNVGGEPNFGAISVAGS